MYPITHYILPEVKNPVWETAPQGIFIPRDHHYNANNKRKKGKKKGVRNYTAASARNSTTKIPMALVSAERQTWNVVAQTSVV